MRHYAFALLAVASVLLCACAKEEQTTGYTRKSITATIDGNGQTRAAVRDVNIVWTDDDAIRVFNADGFASEVWNIRDDDSGLETARFFFIGEPQLASGEEAFAAFPAASVTALADSKLTVTLPETVAFDTQTVDASGVYSSPKRAWCPHLGINLPGSNINKFPQLLREVLSEG